MKRKYSVTSILVLFCMSVCACSHTLHGGADSSNAAAQGDSGRGQATLQLEGGNVAVDYGRPLLRGRDLEKLISPGQEWRMGMNDPTKLKTDVDLKFGDKRVPKGEYVLKAKMDDQRKWVMLIQTEDQKSVAEVPLTFQKVDNAAETMTIELMKKGSGGTFILHWGNLTLSADFQKA